MSPRRRIRTGEHGVRPVLVLGTPCTGTAEIARAVNLLGASLGQPESVGKFSENKQLRRINQALLDVLGGDWDCPPVMHQGWTRGPATQVVTPARARAAVLAEFGDAPVGVWKDLRACLTLPFWLPVFDETPVVIFVHRHPVEVAEALHNARGFGRAHALAIWERCNHDALMHAAGLPTFAIDHQTLVEDPAGVAKRMVAALDGWDVHFDRELDGTDLELAPRDRFHRAPDLARFDDPVATAEQRELFRILQDVEGASGCFALPERLPGPNPISLELLALAGRVRVARHDTIATELAFDQTAGSRRRLVRTFLERTLPDRVLPRVEPAGSPPRR